MKNKNIVLTALASVLVLTAAVGSTWSYFSTYAEAKGGYEITLGDEEYLHEEVDGTTKHIVIENDKKSIPVYVRATAYSGEQIELVFSGNGWSNGNDGFWYYNEPLLGGESTQELVIDIIGFENTNHKDGDVLNVAVVYESTPAIYSYDEASGTYTSEANWNNIYDSSESSNQEPQENGGDE